MSRLLPDTVDALRMVAAGRSFQGSLPLSRLPRLVSMLADAQGEVAYELSFIRDEVGCAQLVVHAEALLPLICQRTLERFLLPSQVDVRLGLIEHERDEAALPPDCEPLLLQDGCVHPAAVIEDELLLALPLIPVKPGSEPVHAGDDAERAAQPPATHNPFAGLGDLLKRN